MKTVYILIRIPKSGSSSLVTMVRESLQGSAIYSIPPFGPSPRTSDNINEMFRQKRTQLKRMLRIYGALNEQSMWRVLNRKIKDNDIVSGHFTYDDPKLISCNTRFITLLRNPVERLISDYSYNREGYLKRPRIRRAYMTGPVKAAGTGTLSEYLEYLNSHHERYCNPSTGYITGSRHHLRPFSFLKENYFHFGILERMDLFSSQLAAKLGTDVTEFWINKTKTREKTDLTEKDQYLINQILGKDIELYNQVKSFILEQ